MPNDVDKTVMYTRHDLQDAIARELGVGVTDHRVDATYTDMIYDWVATASIPEDGYGAFFSDDPVAGEQQLQAAREWAQGRILL